MRRPTILARTSALLEASEEGLLDCGDGVRLLGYLSGVPEPRGLVVSGGVACVLGTLAIARWAPEFANYLYEPEGKYPDSPDPTGELSP